MNKILTHLLALVTQTLHVNDAKCLQLHGDKCRVVNETVIL